MALEPAKQGGVGCLREQQAASCAHLPHLWLPRLIVLCLLTSSFLLCRSKYGGVGTRMLGEGCSTFNSPSFLVPFSLCQLLCKHREEESWVSLQTEVGEGGSNGDLIFSMRAAAVTSSSKSKQIRWEQEGP